MAMIRTLVAAAAASCCSLAGLAQTAAARPALSLLPPSAYAALQFGGLGAGAPAARAWPAAAMLVEALDRMPVEMRAEGLDRGLDEAADGLLDGLAHLGLRTADLRALLDCRMTLAVGRLTTVGMGPSLALLVEFGQHEAAVDRVLAALLAQFERRGGLEGNAVAFGSVAAREFETGEGVPLLLAKVAGNLVLTNSKGLLGEMVEVAAGRTAALDVGGYTQLPAAPLLGAFVHTGRLFGMLEPVLPYEAAGLADALGFGKVEHLYAAFGADAAGGFDQVRVAVAGAATGLLKAASRTPADLSFADLCSENTVVFAAQSLDLPALLDAGRRLLEFLPNRARQAVEQQIARDLRRDLREIGMSPAELESLLRAFGDQIAWSIGLEAGPIPKPEVLARMTVRDPHQVAALLGRFEQVTAEQEGFEWRERDVDGLKIRYFALPLGEQLQLTPCYAFVDGALLFGSDVMGLVRALRRSGTPASLRQQPDFAALAADVAGAGKLLYVRGFRLAELGWRSVESFVFPQLDAMRDENGFGSEILPDLETVAAALGTSTYATWADDAGATQKHRGFLTGGTFLAAMAVAIDEILARAAARER
jgi:hypothetical protein